MQSLVEVDMHRLEGVRALRARAQITRRAIISRARPTLNKLLETFDNSKGPTPNLV